MAWLSYLPSAVLSVSGAGFLAWGAWTYLSVRRIRDTPTSKAAGAAAGLVELFGKARGDGGVESHLSGSGCVASRLVIEKYSSFKNSYTPVLTDHRGSSFHLDDGSGKVLVETAGADLRLSGPSGIGWTFLLPDGHAARTRAEARAVLDGPQEFSLGPIQSYVLGPAAGSNEALMAQSLAISSLPDEGAEQTEAGARAERLNGFLDRHPAALACLKAAGPGFVKVSERLIGEGTELYVMGTAEVREGPGRAAGPENLVVRKGDGGILIISDTSEKTLLSSKERLVLALMGLGILCFVTALMLI